MSRLDCFTNKGSHNQYRDKQSIRIVNMGDVMSKNRLRVKKMVATLLRKDTFVRYLLAVFQFCNEPHAKTYNGL